MGLRTAGRRIRTAERQDCGRLHYALNQEKYLIVFLEDRETPPDNFASERGIRSFCVGKKNRVLINQCMAHRQALWFIALPNEYSGLRDKWAESS